ncbi:hypothetical protein B0H13DRAFT_2321923 [Mycena leptocephala]|nr:hypothetical protein B0H13DRAFT_2321923 [Mycena leptocephala]
MTSQGRRHPAAPTSTPATGWAQVPILGAIDLDGRDAGEVCLFYAVGSAFSLAWSDSSSGESTFGGAAGVLGYVSSSSTMPRVTPAQRVGDSAGMHEGSLEKVYIYLRLLAPLNLGSIITASTFNPGLRVSELHLPSQRLKIDPRVDCGAISFSGAYLNNSPGPLQQTAGNPSHIPGVLLCLKSNPNTDLALLTAPQQYSAATTILAVSFSHEWWYPEY